MTNSPSASNIWTQYLQKDEEILWQGQPYPHLHLRRGDIGKIIGGIMAMIISTLIVTGAVAFVKPLEGIKMVFLIVFCSFLLAVFLYGLYLAVFQFHFAAKRRRKTHYAITNQRAMALVVGNKPKFEDGPLDDTTNLDYVPGEHASIYYKKTAKREMHSVASKQGHDPGPLRDKNNYKTRYIYQGFELITDGAKAYQTMLEVLGEKLANPEASATSNNGEAWQDFLFEGEKLLWQGAPSIAPRPTKVSVVVTIIGLIFMYYFGMLAQRILFSDPDNSGVLVIGIFAAAMFTLGLWMALGHWILDIQKRKAIRYALTNQRAFVASSLGKRKMLSYTLKPDYRPLLIKGLMDNVTFGEEDWFDSKGNKTKRSIAFEFLKEGQQVFDMLTEISARPESRG